MRSKNPTKNIAKLFYKYGAISLLLVFATLQFFLILRHKSPYLSDSYFYKHIFYEMKGDSFDTARQKIISQVDFQKADDITKNFFIDETSYKNSLSFFTKRPYYPFIARLVDLFAHSEYFAFIIPVFLGYFFSVILAYQLFKISLTPFFSAFAVALLVSFYPFLDWSTYFLTDTIGFAFWLGQLFLIYRYVSDYSKNALVYYSVVFFIALLNREQNLLFVPLLLFLWIFSKISEEAKTRVKRLKAMILLSIMMSAAYLLVLILLKQPNFYNTLVYNHTDFGLHPSHFTFKETIFFLFDSVRNAHILFFAESLKHHWWFLFVIMSTVGMLKNLISKNMSLISNLMLSSGFASYLFIFFHPVLSYRYFFPVAVTIIYFSSRFILDFFSQHDSFTETVNSA